MKETPSRVQASRKRLHEILERLLAAYGTRPWNWYTRQRPFDVLIGTVLSQRTRDEKTNEAAEALLARYPSVQDLALAPLENIERLVRPANYYRTKAARIQSICRALLDRHAGEVPCGLEPLIALPGVGRKTAACVMVYGFGEPAIPVDTHVHRLANRMGLICTGRPEETERALWGIAQQEHVLFVNELFVKHGQNVCKPARPMCERCSLADLCDQGRRFSQETDPKAVDLRRCGQRGASSKGPTQSRSRQASSRKERSPLSR